MGIGSKARAIDHHLRQNPLTLAEIRQCLPKSSFAPIAYKSWFTLLRIILCLSLFIYLETKTENILWLLPLWFLHGQVLVGLFVLGHDCGHYTFSKNKKINLLIGYLSMSPLGNGLFTWKLTHDHHHAHTQKRGQEVDWSKRLLTEEEFRKTTWQKNFVTRFGYLLPFGIFYWVGFNAIYRGIKKREILNRELTDQQSRSVLISNLVMILVMVVLYGVLAYLTGFWGMFKYHGIPATVAMMTGYYLLIIQHANPDSIWYEEKSWTSTLGQLASTFDVRFPRFFEWLWLDINIHVPHHVAPNIPWYHLREARKALLKHYPELYQERKFSVREVKWMLRTPFLKHTPEPGFYEF